MGNDRVPRPIFFIGMPRSGTTIMFEAFARHQQLGYLTNHTQKFPRWLFLGFLIFFLDNKLIYLISTKGEHSPVPLGSRFLPKPWEAYSFWNYYTGRDFAKNSLRNQICTHDKKIVVLNALSRLLKWQKKARFSTKLTGPPRIVFLHSIFPDAKFIHIIRDGRAVVSSLLQVPFWRQQGGFDKPFWNGVLSGELVNQWLVSNKDPAVLAALQWKHIIEAAREEKKRLLDDQYMEVRYEDFMESPHTVLSHLYRFCGLSDSKRAHDFLDKGPEISSRSHKYKELLQPDTIATITHYMQPLLGDIGYY